MNRPSEKKTIELVENLHCWADVQFDFDFCRQGVNPCLDPRDNNEECANLWERMFHTPLIMFDGSTDFDKNIRYLAVDAMILVNEMRKSEQ